MRNIISVLAFSGLALLLSSCSNTKYIPANDALYTGAKVKLEAPEISRKKRKLLKASLEGMTRPRPNSSILGLRPKLWFYNIAGNPKKKNSPAALLKKMGEPPVLLSDVSLDHNVSVLQNALENQGFFRATVSGDTTVKNKRASATYTAVAGPQYTINEVVYEADSSDLQKAILRTARRRSLLKPEDPFNLDVIKGERTRIDTRLKERGFYFFNPEYLLVDADTTIGGNKVNLYVNTKKETPAIARRTYTIRNVYVYPNYSLSTTDSDTNKQMPVSTAAII